MTPLWVRRRLLNWRDLARWANEHGVKKMMPPDQLHLTLMTARKPVDWSLFDLQENEITIPAGPKPIQIFGWTVKAVAFDSEEIERRHEELAALYPQMDHAERVRPHVSLYRGGKLVHATYDGKLRFGPEEASEFTERGRRPKHLKVADLC